MQMLLVFCVLPLLASASPRGRLAREAAEEDAPLMAEARGGEEDAPETAPLMAGPPVVFSPLVHRRLVYHAPNCTTENVTITTKQCKTEFTEICEDIEVPVQTIEYQDECINVTTTLCTPITAKEKEKEEAAEDEMADDPSLLEMVVDAAEEAAADAFELRVAEDEAGAMKVRREAEPFLVAAPGHPIPHIQPLPYFVQQTCEDVTKEHCYKRPTINNSKETKNVCRKDPKVNCEDVEMAVPKTTCIHIPHVPEFIY